MSKLRRGILYGALGLAALIVAAPVATVIVLHTDWGRERVRGVVEDRLAETFTGGATLGRIEGSPFGALVLRDLVINGPDGEPAITAKTVRLRIALLPLLSKQARLEELIAEDVEVILDRDERGELEIARLMRPGPKSGWSAELRDVQVHRGQVSYETGPAERPRLGERVHLDAVELAAAADLPFERPIAASVELDARWRERELPLRIEGSVATGEVLSIERALVRAGELVVTGKDVRIGETAGGNPAISGTVAVDAPRAAVARLGVGVETPADLAVKVTATPVPASPWTRIELAGRAGDAPVSADLRADLDGRRFTGKLSTGTLDLTTLSSRRIEGAASVAATFDAALPEDRELPVGTATADVTGTLEGVPETTARIALSSTGEEASGTVDVTGRDLRANVAAQLGVKDGAITLHRGTLTARTGDPQRATGGAAPVRGALSAELTASGALAPEPSLAVAGKIDGRRLRFRDLSIDSMKLAIDARRLPSRPIGRAELAARGVVRGDMHLAELAVTAANRTDGKIAVALRTRPKQHPWLFEADALVTPGDVVAIDLLRHHVRVGSGADWRGTSGRITIAPAQIEVRRFATRSETGALAVDGTYHRAGRRAGDLQARLEAKSLALSTFRDGYTGTASADVELARTRGRFTGRAEVAGRGIALRPGVAPLDADVKLDVREGRLAADVQASGARLGRIGLAADVDAPRDATDARAWQALGRSALREGRLVLARVDVGGIAALAGQEGEHRGVIDGELRLSGTTAAGAVTLRGLVTPATRTVGRIDADLQLAQTPRGELAPSVAVRVDGIGRADARAAIATPARPFDPAAWRRLGRQALASAEVRTSEVAFDPGMLDRFGVATNLRGRASLAVELGAGAWTANVAARVRELRGDPIAEPVNAELTAVAGTGATTFRLAAGSAAARLVEASGRIPRSLAQLQADPRTAPIAATVTLPDVPARALLGVLGRRDATAGTISGTIDVAGTVAAPTGRARITIAGVALQPVSRRRPTKPLDRLVVDASWDGRAGSVALAGTQPGGTLNVAANGSPDALDRAILTVRAKQFDLRPLLVFVPGAASASAGVLDADLTVTSLDPRTARATGELHLTGGRLPLAPTIGTLRDAKIDVIAGARDIRLAVAGKLGGGTVQANGTIALAGATPTGGDLTLTLRDVAPIGAVEPEIDADVKAKLTKPEGRWVADVTVSNAAVRVPDDRGVALKPVGPPADMVFVAGDPEPGQPRSPRRQLSAEEAQQGAVLTARIQLDPTYVQSQEVRGYVRGRLTLTVGAEALRLVGVVEAERADLDLFGRRYLVERAAARFDGSTDPRLDVVITHDFPEVTTVTSVRGRLSKPELIMASDPSIYSQGQLLGFLLGGEPNGQPATGNPRDRVTAAGTSLVANQLTGYVKRGLPFDIDVLRYEAATSSSSAAFTVGTWLSRSLFVAYRQRFETRPEENTGEAQVEYWITRRFMVDGVLGDQASGVDLLWRKRY
jgi:uncharacterized protein involved in outer membrane biogenesis